MQALALWLVALLPVPFVRHVALMWACVAVAVVSTILLGQWHQRHARPDTAVGAFVGAVLWPALTGVSLIVINIISAALSDFE